MDRPGILDVAKLAGVSHATVSYVLNNRPQAISERTRKKVLDAVRSLAYSPDQFARGLKTRISNTVAVIVPTLMDPSFPIMIKGMAREARTEGYSLIIHELEGDAGESRRAPTLLLQSAVDGVICVSPAESEAELIAATVEEIRVPLVVAGSWTGSDTVASVSYDYRRAGSSLAECLFEQGHRRMAFVCTGGHRNARSKMLRFEGIAQFLAARGLVPEMIRVKPREAGGFYDLSEYRCGVWKGEQLAKRALRWTALIGSNDQITVGLMHALRAGGRQIPEEVSLAAFGGGLLSEMVDPMLTVVEIPALQIGAQAFRLLLERMRGAPTAPPRTRVVLEAGVILRGSVNATPSISRRKASPTKGCAPCTM